jgi:hypothetical protein
MSVGVRDFTTKNALAIYALRERIYYPKASCRSSMKISLHPFLDTTQGNGHKKHILKYQDSESCPLRVIPESPYSISPRYQD